jgi:hypothetical protein
VVNGKSLALGLQLTQASLGLFERLAGAISLRFDPSQLLAPVAILIGSLRRFVFPLRSAVSDFGQLTHDAPSGQGPPQRATGGQSVIGQMKMAQEDRAIRGGMHLQSERGGRAPD